MFGKAVSKSRPSVYRHLEKPFKKWNFHSEGNYSILICTLCYVLKDIWKWNLKKAWVLCWMPQIITRICMQHQAMLILSTVRNRSVTNINNSSNRFYSPEAIIAMERYATASLTALSSLVRSKMRFAAEWECPCSSALSFCCATANRGRKQLVSPHKMSFFSSYRKNWQPWRINQDYSVLKIIVNIFLNSKLHFSKQN